MKHWFRVMAGFAGLAASTMSLSGCVSSPTYGTSKTAGEHLLDDVTSVLSVVPDTKNDQIAYQPRPKLVVPGNTDVLPQPQKSIADASTNPNWVESPEAARERLKAEADAHAEDRTYRSPLLGPASANAQMSAEDKQKAYREARKIQQGAYIDKRRFLSDPPADYRRVDSANLNDLGEPEKKKERERKKEAEIAGKSSGNWFKDLFD